MHRTDCAIGSQARHQVTPLATPQDNAVQRFTASLLLPSLPSRLWTVVCAAALWGLISPAHADSASDLHAQLKERWYTTELVVFRYTSPSSTESLRFEGERVNAEEYDKLPLTDETQESTVAVLTLGGTSEDIAKNQRPAFDVEPGDAIQDYADSEDLGALVARNMATWENQLRSADGEPIDVEQLTLTEQVAKLETSRGIEVLTHTGWTQAVPERGNGKPVTIAGGETFVDPRNGDSRSRLEGEVTVTLGRYLHVQPTLYYTPEYTPEFPPMAGRAATAGADATTAGNPQTRPIEVRDLTGGVSALDRLRDRAALMENAEALDDKRATDFEQELPPYTRLEQSRRVRSGELHYIDHPEIGVLVRVTPVAAPALLQEQFTLLQ